MGIFVSLFISLQLLALYNIVCEATPGLVLPEERTSGLGCIPEGRTVSYQCTVQGGVVTVWIGSAINCSHTMPPRIVLEHHLFKANGVHSSCGLMAMSVSVNEITKEYTSRLIFTADTDLHAKTINCTKDFSEVVGFDSIKIGVPPPPPGPLTITLSSESSLTVSWSPPTGPVEGGVGGYVFSVTGEECGCVSMNVSGDTTSVTCSGWTAAGQTCSFEVRTLSQDCGFISEPVNENVSLSKPPAPTELLVRFTLFVNNTLQVEVEFMGVTPPVLGSNLKSTVNYTVIVSGGNQNISKNFTNIQCGPSNRCTSIENISDLLTPRDINFSVVAYNVLGSGPPTYYIECNPFDLVVTVGFNPTPLTFKGTGVFNISYGRVLYTGVAPKSVASVVCDEGFRPTFDINRTCMFGGQWSEGNLICEVMPVSTRPPDTGTSCPSSCIIASVVVLFVVTSCVVLFVFIICCKFWNKEKAEVQVTGIFTIANTTSASHSQSERSTTSGNRLLQYESIQVTSIAHSEEPSNPQLDNYAQPEDLISKPHLPKQRFEGENTVHKLVQYESLQEIRSTKRSTPHDHPQELYSEVFDALPKGKSTKVVDKSM